MCFTFKRIFVFSFADEIIKMDPIKNIVSDIIGRMSSGLDSSSQNIQAVWLRVSKDKESRVIDFKNGCLMISADSAMRLVKLNLNREIFLKEIQKEIPSIVKISFKVGSI